MVLLLVMLAGCSTTAVSLDYTRLAVPSKDARRQVAVGAFADRRGGEPRQLGAIRGGLGNALKTLELSEDASVVVQKAFAQALGQRGLLVAPGSARYTLGGAINKLDCSRYVRREAHAEIIVSLTNNTTGKVVMQKAVHGNVVEEPSGAFDTGIGGSVDDLRAVAAKALQEAIDNALADAQFKQAMAVSPG
jgi:uncharacterized lipoprotein YajG